MPGNIYTRRTSLLLNLIRKDLSNLNKHVHSLGLKQDPTFQRCGEEESSTFTALLSGIYENFDLSIAGAPSY